MSESDGKRPKLRLGIVGMGVIGETHLQAALKSERIAVVAVADLLESRATEVATLHGIPRNYRSGKQLLDDGGIDAVILAVPTRQRYELAVDALKRGLHVLLEKPAAMHASQLRHMLQLRGDGVVVACCSSRYRFTQVAVVATEFVARGALGPLKMLRCRAIQPADAPPESPRPSWRVSRTLNGGGILANWGSYDLDFLMGVTGWTLSPQQVLAQHWPVSPRLGSHVAPESDGECHYSALVLCDGGGAIQIERGEFLPMAADNAWQVIGRDGSLRLTMSARETEESLVVHDYATADSGLISEVLWRGRVQEADVQSGPVRDFTDAILDRRPPMTSLEQAIAVQSIIDAVYESADRSEAVSLESSQDAPAEQRPSVPAPHLVSTPARRSAT